MTLEPTHRNSLNGFDGKPLRTIRVWVAEPCGDIMEYIVSKGLGDAVLEAVPLDETCPIARIRLPDGRPKDCLLVDLAVVERESLRVRDHFTTVALPLNDVSFVILTLDSELEERKNLLRHYLIHRRYLQQCSQRKNEGNASDLLFAWYNNRFIEIRDDIRKSFLHG